MPWIFISLIGLTYFSTSKYFCHFFQRLSQTMLRYNLYSSLYFIKEIWFNRIFNCSFFFVFFSVDVDVKSVSDSNWSHQDFGIFDWALTNYLIQIWYKRQYKFDTKSIECRRENRLETDSTTPRLWPIPIRDWSNPDIRPIPTLTSTQVDRISMGKKGWKNSELKKCQVMVVWV